MLARSKATETIKPTSGQITGQRVRYEVRSSGNDRLISEGHGIIVAFTEEQVVVETDDGLFLFVHPASVRVVQP